MTSTTQDVGDEIRSEIDEPRSHGHIPGSWRVITMGQKETLQISHGSTSAIRIPAGRLAGYCITTVLVTFELVASFIWVMVGTQYVVNNLTHLGYPLYLPNIIGLFDLPGAVVLLAPGLTRIKE
jgi:hypothetical protein